MTDDETTHTPGPWQTQHTDTEGVEVVRQGSEEIVSWHIATVNGAAPDDLPPHPLKSATGANARLIAAAPDLLAAARRAEKVLSWVEDRPPTAQHEEVEALEALRDAIDKAT